MQLNGSPLRRGWRVRRGRDRRAEQRDGLARLDGEVDAVHGDRVAVPGICGDDGPADDEPGGVAEFVLADHFAQFLDDSGEHAG